MAYIAPNSTVHLLRGVPLNKDYENTLYFSTASAQYNYFYSKIAYTFTSVSYQRQHPNYITLELPSDDAMTCNYLMYNNTSFRNKWFYAFIDRVEYISNRTARIYFTIDLLQTWHFDYQIDDCFIERNHTKTDFFKDSLTPEPVDIGEYIDNYEETVLSGNCYIVVATVDTYVGHESEAPDLEAAIPIVGDITTQDAPPTNGHIYQGVYSGCTYTMFPLLMEDPDTPGTYISNENIDLFLGYYIKQNKAGAIVSIFMIPQDAFSVTIPEKGYEIPDGAVSLPNTIQLTGINTVGSTPDTLSGYTPKNKKLYVYPYNYMEIDNGSGDKIDLKYEKFLDPTAPQVQVAYNVQLPVSTILEPLNYNGIGSTIAADVNHDYQLMLTDYPMCSWNVDSYAAWSAQRSLDRKMMVGSTLANAGMAVASLGTSLIGTAVKGIGSLISELFAGMKARRAPDKLYGSNSSGNGALAQQRLKYFVTRKSVTAQNAKIIDDFFSMFGYSINTLYSYSANDDPRNHRPYYTYLKTVGCEISGNLPAEDINEIAKLYDKGIRWWKSNIGNYSVDNSPSQGGN